MQASHKPTIPCPVCGGTEVVTVATKDRNGNSLHNVLCQCCGLVWVDPQPSKQETEAFYAKDYRKSYKGAYQPKPKHCIRETMRAINRANELETHIEPGIRILDIGAGAGFFAFVLLKKGIIIDGIEPNEDYARFARESLGVSNVKTGFLLDIPAQEQYDLITINHVFEHLPNPREAIDHIGQLLKPGGKLLLEVPNIEATYHSPNKVFHVGHLYWYNPNTIKAMAASAGLRALQTTLKTGTKHIFIVFTKPDEPRGDNTENTNEPLQACLNGNSTHVSRILEQRSILKHYLTVKPYIRFTKKMLQYAKENLNASGSKDPKSICDSTYQKHCKHSA
jgi:2-polyprenyl-3-methyl-5-hydroxy-6-metoxy-1,4-benzoquinol methylase